MIPMIPNSFFFIQAASVKFQFIVLLHWRGSAQGFPWGKLSPPQGGD